VFVLIVGCGRVGSALAREMVNDGHDVSIIDQSPEGFARLGEEFPGTFIQGPALELTVLKAAGIERADAFVAATDGDNTNVVISQVARDPVRGGAGARPLPREVLRRARPHHDLPDSDRDRADVGGPPRL